MPDDRPTGTWKTDSFQETLDDHRECMQVVSEIEACLDQPPDNAGQWVAQLLQRLPGLARTMREHFEDEEGGLLYAELPRRRPHLAVRLAALKEEHPRMLVEIEKTIDIATHLREAELYELRELNARIQLLVARIRRHEAAENELIFEAYWEDIGTGD
ncbi:MAG: hemerythrin domain-containing protein [Acidobacteriota bacterium]